MSASRAYFDRFPFSLAHKVFAQSRLGTRIYLREQEASETALWLARPAARPLSTPTSHLR